MPHVVRLPPSFRTHPDHGVYFVPQRVPEGDVLPGDIDVHREIAAIIENPLYLLLDTTDGAGVRDLPVQMLESEVF